MPVNIVNQYSITGTDSQTYFAPLHSTVSYYSAEFSFQRCCPPRSH